MKRIVLNKEQKLLNHLILHSHDTPKAFGLFNGMTGIMLVLAHYARVRKIPLIENISDFLMEKITTNLPTDISIDFADGAAGLGWGIEFLIQEGYMKGCGVEITHELDERIMSFDIRRMTDLSLEKGVTGLFHYVISHIQGAFKNRKQAFDEQYLNDWQHTLRYLISSHPNERKWVNMQFELNEVLRGTQLYEFNLAQFVKPLKNAPMNILGLRKGLAGYLELKIQK